MKLEIVGKVPQWKFNPPKRGDWNQLGREMVSMTQRRTLAGQDVEYGALSPYAEQSGRAGSVNLSDTGRMLNSLSARTTKDGVELYFADSQRAIVALAHQTGSGHLPVRKHFGFNESDAKQIMDKLNAIISSALRRDNR